MSDPSGLFGEFCDALNGELEKLGCDLRIARDQLGADDTMLLVDSTGRELGWLPDHVDAESIAAIQRILAKAGWRVRSD